MEKDFINQYKKYNRRKVAIILGLFFLLLLSAQVAVLIGAFDISLKNIYSLWTEEEIMIRQVVVNIRLPRILAAILSGAILAMSGVVSQSLLRNPLASPFTLGISSSAAFGAAFGIVFLGGAKLGGNTLVYNQYIVGFSAFLWSLVSVVLIVFLSKLKKSNPQTIILAGVVLSSLFGAGISAMQYFATDVQLASIVFWSFGDMARADWQDIGFIFVCFLFCFGYFMKKSWDYNSLKTGDDYAKSIGIHPERIRVMGLVITALITALIVALYGIIGFIGLLGPHIMRRIVGGHEAYLIPASAVFGALLLLLADTFARTIISPIILPVGIVTSFLGAPLFIYLLIKSKN